MIRAIEKMRIVSSSDVRFRMIESTNMSRKSIAFR